MDVHEASGRWEPLEATMSRPPLGLGNAFGCLVSGFHGQQRRDAEGIRLRIIQAFREAPDADDYGDDADDGLEASEPLAELFDVQGLVERV